MPPVALILAGRCLPLSCASLLSDRVFARTMHQRYPGDNCWRVAQNATWTLANRQGNRTEPCQVRRALVRSSWGVDLCRQHHPRFVLGCHPDMDPERGIDGIGRRGDVSSELRRSSSISDPAGADRRMAGDAWPGFGSNEPVVPSCGNANTHGSECPSAARSKGVH